MTDYQTVDKSFLAKAVYLGIDQSLARTGLCYETADGLVQPCLLLPPDKIKPIDRLVWLRAAFAEALSHANLKAVAIEGYSFGSKFHREKLGELGGILRLALHDRELPAVIAQPTQVKKFVSGQATGKKANIIKEVYKAWGVDVDDDNEADAVVLCQIAGAWSLRRPMVRYREEVLDKLEILRPKLTLRPPVRSRIARRKI